MSREKQIEEMAHILCGTENSCDNCMFNKVNCYERLDSEQIYAKGYRKFEDVVHEVVSTAKAIFCPDCDYDVADIRYNLDWLEAELKKKYTKQA